MFSNHYSAITLTVETDIMDVAVSKHLSHIRLLQSLLEGNLYHFFEVLIEVLSEFRTMGEPFHNFITILAEDEAANENLTAILRPEEYFLFENNMRTSHFRGSAYFLDQIRILSCNLSRIQHDYSIRMEQKRDFVSHVIGVFTIIMAPMAVMTSYWVSPQYVFNISKLCVIFFRG